MCPYQTLGSKEAGQLTCPGEVDFEWAYSRLYHDFKMNNARLAAIFSLPCVVGVGTLSVRCRYGVAPKPGAELHEQVSASLPLR
jgi:hypothetical protein